MEFLNTLLMINGGASGATCALQAARAIVYLGRVRRRTIPSQLIWVAGACALAAAAGGCAMTERRAFLVVGADVETKLAAQACTEATRVLGDARARALLDGHVIRMGEKLVIAVRDWREGESEPSLRVTIAADPELQAGVALPNPEIVITATRSDAAGARARNLIINSGTIQIMRVVKEFDISVELYFNDPAERPFRVAGRLPILELYRLDACDGRALPTAPPSAFLRP